MVEYKYFDSFTLVIDQCSLNGEFAKYPNEKISYNIHYDLFTQMYYLTLLGCEFANCYGQGSTKESAISSLKIRVYQLRRKKRNNTNIN